MNIEDAKMECSLCGNPILEPEQMCSRDTTPCNPVMREEKPIPLTPNEKQELRRRVAGDWKIMPSDCRGWIENLLATLDQARKLAEDRRIALKAEWSRVQGYREQMDRMEKKLKDAMTVKPYQNNCAVLERTVDDDAVGRCWYWLTNGECPRHGNVEAVQDRYVKTGKLTDELDLRRMKETK